MTPKGATHRLKQGFAKLDQPMFIKWVDGGKSSYWMFSDVDDSFNSWEYIPNCLINIELYEPITKVDCDAEDACFNAIENKIECNGVLDENS